MCMTVPAGVLVGRGVGVLVGVFVAGTGVLVGPLGVLVGGWTVDWGVGVLVGVFVGVFVGGTGVLVGGGLPPPNWIRIAPEPGAVKLTCPALRAGFPTTTSLWVESY